MQVEACDRINLKDTESLVDRWFDFMLSLMGAGLWRLDYSALNMFWLDVDLYSY